MRSLKGIEFRNSGISVVVQWLPLCAVNAGERGSRDDGGGGGGGV